MRGRCTVRRIEIFNTLSSYRKEKLKINSENETAAFGAKRNLMPWVGRCAKRQ